ncbi:hypothetical protein [Glycomyces xiaoerkulensis]|uniref:hypothetical protein n=1 Tax=Glycomyces xiaoerkulensis TaxID=2038139 RepID=UPI000C25AD44|nr:hypothetical protein [Glycomyces xiaoerkulensis]
MSTPLLIAHYVVSAAVPVLVLVLILCSRRFPSAEAAEEAIRATGELGLRHFAAISGGPIRAIDARIVALLEKGLLTFAEQRRFGREPKLVLVIAEGVDLDSPDFDESDRRILRLLAEHPGDLRDARKRIGTEGHLPEATWLLRHRLVSTRAGQRALIMLGTPVPSALTAYLAYNISKARLDPSEHWRFSVDWGAQMFHLPALSIVAAFILMKILSMMVLHNGRTSKGTAVYKLLMPRFAGYRSQNARVAWWGLSAMSDHELLRRLKADGIRDSKWVKLHRTRGGPVAGASGAGGFSVSIDVGMDGGGGGGGFSGGGDGGGGGGGGGGP